MQQRGLWSRDHSPGPGGVGAVEGDAQAPSALQGATATSDSGGRKPPHRPPASSNATEAAALPCMLMRLERERETERHTPFLVGNKVNSTFKGSREITQEHCVYKRPRSSLARGTVPSATCSGVALKLLSYRRTRLLSLVSPRSPSDRLLAGHTRGVS